MSFQVASQQIEGYRVAVEVFEGPLDLLLELIERAELDITSLALAQVTDQYLAYLRNLEQQEAAGVSAFLVIAARLLQIKSAALLPRPSIDAIPEEMEDPAEALARQLLIYKRFKELAASLDQRQNSGLRTYLRLAPAAVKVEAKLDLSNITLQDLMLAARSVFSAKPNLPSLSRVVSRPRVTIRERIHSILNTLKANGQASFRNLVSGRRDRLELVVTFLAMLELIKRRIVEARQDGLFSDIDLIPSSEWADDEPKDLEFE